MFGIGSKRHAPIRSLVGEGMVIKGDLLFSDGLRVDGEVTGDVCARDEGTKSILVISENARVHGMVKAAHVIINGAVNGSVHSSEMLELQPKARVVGDVQYELLEMHPGSSVEGELKPLKSIEKPTLKLAIAKNA